MRESSAVLFRLAAEILEKRAALESKKAEAIAKLEKEAGIPELEEQFDLLSSPQGPPVPVIQPQEVRVEHDEVEAVLPLPKDGHSYAARSRTVEQLTGQVIFVLKKAPKGLSMQTMSDELKTSTSRVRPIITNLRRSKTIEKIGWRGGAIWALSGKNHHARA